MMPYKCKCEHVLLWSDKFPTQIHCNPGRVDYNDKLWQLKEFDTMLELAKFAKESKIDVPKSLVQRFTNLDADGNMSEDGEALLEVFPEYDDREEEE